MKIAVIITTLLVSAVTVFADGRITGEFNGQLVAAGSGRILLLDKTGKVLWQHTGGNCSDIWMLENGNVLHADNNVAEINPKTDETVWSYRPEMQESGGTFSCQRLKNGNTLVGENSSGRLVEVDKAGKIVFELKLPLCIPGDHDNLRIVTITLSNITTALTAAVSAADRDAGVSAALKQEAGLARVVIKSPASREVKWAVTFQKD